MAIVRLGNKDLQAPGAGGAELVTPASYNAGHAAGPHGHPMAHASGPAGVNAYVAGITTPQYGMPYVGTPIGLPGPPHIPFGAPAGLQHHAVHNHTKSKIPHPVDHFDIHVKQVPGFSYPQPVSQVNIEERAYPAAPMQPYCPNCPP
jgi:hypothetical protein